MSSLAKGISSKAMVIDHGLKESEGYYCGIAL